MSELDLPDLVRSATQNEMRWFAQASTLDFAMIVAIYRFLNRARIALGVFGLFAQLIGMAVFPGDRRANIRLC